MMERGVNPKQAAGLCVQSSLEMGGQKQDTRHKLQPCRHPGPFLLPFFHQGASFSGLSRVLPRLPQASWQR